jgi:hypothetical protein
MTGLNWNGPFADYVLAGILNELRKFNTPNYEKLERLVHDMTSLDRLLASVGYPQNLESVKNLKLRNTASALKARIDQYWSEFTYRASPDLPAQSGWGINLQWQVTKDSPKGTVYIVGLYIFEGAFRGLLRHISQCKSCNQWFVALRKDQKFCSGKCREKTFRGSSDGKAKRAAYMRRYRAGLKRRDRENLRVTEKKG